MTRARHPPPSWSTRQLRRLKTSSPLPSAPLGTTWWPLGTLVQVTDGRPHGCCANFISLVSGIVDVDGGVVRAAGGMGAAQTAGQAAPSASLMPGLRAPKLRSHPAENAPHATRRGHGPQTRQGVWRGSGRPGSAVHRRDVQLRTSFVLLQIHKTISALIEAQTNLFALFFFF